MAKVVLNKEPPTQAAPTPTAEVSQTANQVIYTTDARGRSLGLRKPSLIQQMRLLEIVGPQASQIEKYMEIAGRAISVVEIDGVVEPPPLSKLALEAKVEELGEDGLMAVEAAWAKNFAPQDMEELKRRLKNLLETLG